MEFENNPEVLTSVIENIITGVCIFSLSENRKIVPVYLNEGFYRMLGYSHKELDKMLSNVRRNIIPDDIPIFEQGIDDILKDDGAVEFEFRTVTGDGNIRWLQVRGNLYGKMEGYPLLAGVIIDATERKTIEEELALQAERINILSESVKEHLLDYNSRTDVLTLVLNKTAFQKGEIVIKNFMEDREFDTIHPEDRDMLVEVIEASRKNPLSDIVEFRSKFFENEKTDYHWYKATITSVRGADGYVSRIVGRVVNIDLEKKRELELKIKADRDALTGLYNKGAATQLITDSIARCKEENTKAALIMIDLDHFKSVNDTFGHAIGDRVIEEAGKILNDTFKGRDVVGRMGGDEFMVFMADIKGVEDAVNISKKLNRALTKHIEDSEGAVTVTASIGIAMCEDDENAFESLYSKADQALYITKEKGRNGSTVYEA